MEDRDRDWIIPVAIILGLEVAAWSALWVTGRAAFPLLLPYEGLAHAAMIPVLAWRFVRFATRDGTTSVASWLRARPSRIAGAAIGLQLFVFGAALFGALKGALPAAVPFWLDPPLAEFERGLLGADPWRLSQMAFGWATPAIDLVYATFLPGHLIAVFVVLTSAPSRWKTRALVSLFLIWLLIGVGTAYALSSVGPLFFDRAFGGLRFAALDSMVARSAPLTRATGNLLWHFHASGAPSVANGISAMPSMHVGLTLWLALVLRGSRYGGLAWPYYALIWLGSVHLGWHYCSDGLVASALVLPLWSIIPLLLNRPTVRPAAPAS